MYKTNKQTCDPMKAVPRGKCIAVSAYKKKLEIAQAQRLTEHLKGIEQKEANASERSRQQEIIKLKTKINQVETESSIQRTNKTRSWFFEKVNNIDKLSARLIDSTVSKLIKSKLKRETKHQKLRKSKNHQILLQKTVLNKPGKFG